MPSFGNALGHPLERIPILGMGINAWIPFTEKSTSPAHQKGWKYMRLFIAAELPTEMREALAETSALLRERVRGRFVAPDSFHVTIAFLGDVDPWRIDDICDAIDEGCEGIPVARAAFGGLGSFGRRAAATLWQGFSDTGRLPELAKGIRRALHARSFEFDEKKFLAHVTLMRAADLRSGTLPSPCAASGEIERVTLFHSDLSGSRPVYEPLHTVELARY